MFMWLLYLLPYVLVPIGLFPVLRWLIRKVRDGVSAIGEKKTTAASHIIKLKKVTLRLPVCIIVFLFLACSLGFGFWEVIINNFYYGALSLLLSLRVFSPPGSCDNFPFGNNTWYASCFFVSSFCLSVQGSFCLDRQTLYHVIINDTYMDNSVGNPAR